MNEFARMLEAEIPRLRRYARALTRDVVRADDLVQSCLTRAVAKQHLWQYGTDLRAWLVKRPRLALLDVSVFGTQGSTPVFSHANT
jgi:DNA-directed RNA polymerase specialized sigma24 family protein